MRVRRIRRVWFWLAVGMAGAVLTGACGGEDSTSVDRPEPVYVDGVPQVTATPSRAPAGTQVHLEGWGFTDHRWRDEGGKLWLVDDRAASHCRLAALAEHDIVVTEDGHLSGSFVVPARGQCRPGPGEVDTGPAAYYIAFPCLACPIGTFTVTLAGESTDEPTGTRCDETVTFGVQNFADEIYADGLSCAEAASFVRAHGAGWQAPDGPAQVDAGGFSCQRTGQSDGLPPRANYRCVMGTQTIWLVRT